MTFDNYNGSQSRVSASLRRYVSKFEEMRNRGLGFVLQGDKGNGKTFLAARVSGKQLRKKIWRLCVIFCPNSDIMIYVGRR